MKSRTPKLRGGDASLPSHCLQGARPSGGGGLPLGSVSDTVEGLYICLRSFFRRKRNTPASVLTARTVPGLFSFHHTCSWLRPTVLCGLKIICGIRGRASKTLALPSLRSSRLPISNLLPDAPSSRPCHISHGSYLERDWAVFLQLYSPSWGRTASVWNAPHPFFSGLGSCS